MLSISFVSTALANDTRRCLAGGDGESRAPSPRCRRLRMLALGEALGENAGRIGGRGADGAGGDALALVVTVANCLCSTRIAKTNQHK